jgi:CRISPR-associated protein Cse1 family
VERRPDGNGAKVGRQLLRSIARSCAILVRIPGRGGKDWLKETKEEVVHYNLLDQEWIPVLYHDGKMKRVGVHTAFAHAERIRQIAASNPMDRVAILRFFLALLYWCEGNPPDGAAPGGALPSDWSAALDENRACFDLLGEGTRFYQRSSSDDKSGQLSANYLIQEVPTGTNLWHFRHSTDGKNGLCLSCCALGLLRLPLFATSGGRGKPPGVNAKPPVYVIPIGSSLADTLLLSWCNIPHPNLGTPTWENPGLELPQEGGVPLLTGLTWLPRRVWLGDPEEPEARCIACGLRDRLVRQCVFGGIGSTRSDEKGQGRVWNDPHVVRDGKDVVKPGNALGAPGAAAGQWAKILNGALNSHRLKRAPKAWVVSFATVQNDKYLEAMDFELPLDGASDRDAIQEITAKRIELWWEEAAKLPRKAKPRKASRKHTEIPPVIAGIRPHIENRVFSMADELMAGSDDSWERAAREYSTMMATVAGSLSPGYTTAAVQRRRQLGRVMPDLKPSQKAAPKNDRKNRGRS